MKIAIAEDEDDIRQFFQSAVQRLGHEVVAAARNGRELIEQSSEEWPDLIITDMQMPEMDGIEATRRICCEHPVPVIVISACDRTEVSRGDGSAHVTTFLVKPVSIRDLKSAITNATGCASA
jgi:CheY-like chemotaxis protein